MLVDIPFRPKLIEALKNYSRQDFIRDLIAGIAVGIVALPWQWRLALRRGWTRGRGFTRLSLPASLFPFWADHACRLAVRRARSSRLFTESLPSMGWTT